MYNVLERKGLMKDNDLKREAFEEELKYNYIKAFAYLVASNIKSLYKHYKNNHNVDYDSMLFMSEDTFLLNDSERANLYEQIETILRDKYNLVITNKDKLHVKKNF